ncbi:MAG: hypothetical protein H7A26_08615 [Spirochaetales bacterium]|nr:hypothetical protein [Spirochaetales bacterium]
MKSLYCYRVTSDYSPIPGIEKENVYPVKKDFARLKGLLAKWTTQRTQ